jgi:Right handed beta helix region
MLSNTGYGFDPHGTGQTMIYSHNMTFRECWVILSSLKAHDNNWDGFAIDKVNNGLIVDCVATDNGRHGFNIITASRNVIVTNNYADNNGHFYMKGNIELH